MSLGHISIHMEMYIGGQEHQYISVRIVLKDYSIGYMKTV